MVSMKRFFIEFWIWSTTLVIALWLQVDFMAANTTGSSALGWLTLFTWGVPAAYRIVHAVEEGFEE